MDGSNRPMTIVPARRDSVARVVAAQAQDVLKRKALQADGVLAPPTPTPAPEFLTPEQKIARLKPGHFATTALPNGQQMRVIGRVPNDRSTRQQRRAAARGAA